jgi:MFS transporter, DHA2 family, methylenomycin A resistance protein
MCRRGDAAGSRARPARACIYSGENLWCLRLWLRARAASAGAGAAFLPMMLIGAALTPFSARLAGKLGARPLIITGLALMTAGLVTIAVLAPVTSAWGLALLMILTGLGGPLVMPPMTAVLLNSVPDHRAGVASGILSTSRQAGGALAVAVFGALLASRADFVAGLRVSLLIAAAAALAAAAVSTRLTAATGSKEGATR